MQINNIETNENIDGDLENRSDSMASIHDDVPIATAYNVNAIEISKGMSERKFAEYESGSSSVSNSVFKQNVLFGSCVNFDVFPQVESLIS